MSKISDYEWGEVWADERDPNAGGASHEYEVRSTGAGLGSGECVFASVHYQHGPRLSELATRGCLDDHILAIAQDRIEGFQAGRFPHSANDAALEHIRAARRLLRARAEERRARGVLGKNLP